jgi:hypothetical protein
MVDKDRILQTLYKEFSGFRTPNADYSIDSQGVVSYDGNLEYWGSEPQLPIKFKHVKGDFRIATKLSSLEGCPEIVGGEFDCSWSGVTSLAGGPRQVGKDYICYKNPITSLEHVSVQIGSKLVARDCQLKNLKHCPDNVQLTVYENPLESLADIPENIDWIQLSYDPQLGFLPALQARRVTVMGVAKGGPSVSIITIRKFGKIFAPYVGTKNPGDILRCASELNEAGFEGNAQW